MASGASRIDTQQQRISITIHAQFNNAHYIARGRTLMPQLAPAATPKVRLTRFLGKAQSIGIHPGNH
jgi:hypothetical protein